MKKIPMLVLSLILAASIVGCDSNKNKAPAENPSTKIILGSSIAIEGEGAALHDHGVLISSGGTYEISGTLDDGSIHVDAADQQVELVLNGVHITNTNGPAILFANSKEAIVTIQEGTDNILIDGGESEYDGVIYSTSSLTIQGGGNLTITGNNNEGIASEMHLNIEGGSIHVTAVDDGLNANNDNVSSITVSGGYLYIESGGDGIDSNGTINISGGTVISLSALTDASGGLDADGEVAISGGTVIATGAKLSLPTSDSSQKSLLITYDNVQKADTLVSIQNEDRGILTFAPAKDYQVLLYSSGDITEGTAYDVYSGGSAAGGEQVDGLYSNATYTPGTKITTVTTDNVNQPAAQAQLNGPPEQAMEDPQKGTEPGDPPAAGQEPPQGGTQGNAQGNNQGGKQGTPPTGSPPQGSNNTQGSSTGNSNGDEPVKPQGAADQEQPPEPPDGGEPGNKPQGDPPGEPPSGERPEPPVNQQGAPENNSST